MKKHIIEKHLEKIGGLEKLKSLDSIFLEGTFEIKGSALSGSYKEWRKYTNNNYYYKNEVDLDVFKETIGLINHTIWKQDISNKVTNATSENLVNEYLVKKEMDYYQFIDDDSGNLITSFEENDEYYILTLNYKEYKISVQLFINKSTWLIDKRIEEKQDETEITTFSNYQLVEGVLFPFEMEFNNVSHHQISTLKISNYSFESLSNTIFEMPENAANDFDFGGNESVENIPIKYFGTHLFIEVLVNGKKGNFVIDSGAEKSIFDSHFCDEIKVEKKGNWEARGVGDTSESISFVTCDTLSIDALTLSNQSLIAMNLNKMLMPVYGLKVDGILGFDFFSRFITKIDYAKETLSVYNPESFKYTGNGQILPIEISEGKIIRIAKVDDKYEGKWLIDTGAGSTSFHYPFAKENNFHTQKGMLFMNGGVGGEYRSKSVRFEKFQIGNFVINQPIIGFPEKPSKGVFASKSKIGNLGNDILRHFIVFFDYTKNQIILEKGDNFNKLFPENHTEFGTELKYDAENNTVNRDKLEVRYVSPESISEKAGLQSGDFIVEVDGKLLSDFKHVVEIKEIFKQPFGTEVNLKVERNNQIKSIKMALEKII